MRKRNANADIRQRLEYDMELHWQHWRNDRFMQYSHPHQWILWRHHYPYSPSRQLCLRYGDSSIQYGDF